VPLPEAPQRSITVKAKVSNLSAHPQVAMMVPACVSPILNRN
jgi:hypothetical protein